MKKRDDDKIIKIQDAVATLILTEGITAVSTIRVAKKVGIAQSNVYLYFKNKAALIDSVFQREMVKIKSAANFQQISDTSLPLTQRIQIYIHTIYTYAVADPDSLTLIQQIKFLKGENTANLVGDLAVDNLVTNLLRAGIQQKILKDLPVNLVMALVFNVVYNHSLNLRRGVYLEKDYGFAQIYPLIWDAIRVTAK
ncbi:transcription regulator [Agrilactobacillus composti DSM 18527 = JCM 14202]|uniref:Transcription regulator n=1 Tax=Agrilactobacillus composti DSM 18527 = JCM 14202 TaxID=1423734 RepID=X0PS49_9LACO|nr:TetR/AcrR family transcriptional regulator [Agrilactobacillus composti]KRM36250.1 transcription regulator [Agrilactobacillus composti DSM 18527 = JCM 14202]GAF39991.1 transcription regulatorf multidrug efflux pump operon [Agrilactobacillus composti DSM 18527 = JCM 14202]